MPDNLAKSRPKPMTARPPVRRSRRGPIIRAAAALLVGAVCSLWIASPGYDRLTVSELVALLPRTAGEITHPSVFEAERERRHATGRYLVWGYSETFARTFVAGENRATPIAQLVKPAAVDMGDAELDAYLAARPRPRPRLPYWSRVGEPNPGVTYQSGTRMVPDFVMHEHAIGWPLRMVGMRARGSQAGWTDLVAERAFVGKRELRWYEALYWAVRWHADQIFVIWPGLVVDVALLAVPAFGLITIAARWVRAAAEARRVRRGLCPTCGYDRASIGAQTACPECGRAAS